MSTRTEPKLEWKYQRQGRYVLKLNHRFLLAVFDCVSHWKWKAFNLLENRAIAQGRAEDCEIAKYHALCWWQKWGSKQ